MIQEELFHYLNMAKQTDQPEPDQAQVNQSYLNVYKELAEAAAGELDVNSNDMKAAANYSEFLLNTAFLQTAKERWRTIRKISDLHSRYPKEPKITADLAAAQYIRAVTQTNSTYRVQTIDQILTLEKENPDIPEVAFFVCAAIMDDSSKRRRSAALCLSSITERAKRFPDSDDLNVLFTESLLESVNEQTLEVPSDNSPEYFLTTGQKYLGSGWTAEKAAEGLADLCGPRTSRAARMALEMLKELYAKFYPSENYLHYYARGLTGSLPFQTWDSLPEVQDTLKSLSEAHPDDSLLAAFYVYSLINSPFVFEEKLKAAVREAERLLQKFPEEELIASQAAAGYGKLIEENSENPSSLQPSLKRLKELCASFPRSEPVQEEIASALATLYRLRPESDHLEDSLKLLRTLRDQFKDNPDIVMAADLLEFLKEEQKRKQRASSPSAKIAERIEYLNGSDLQNAVEKLRQIYLKYPDNAVVREDYMNGLAFLTEETEDPQETARLYRQADEVFSAEPDKEHLVLSYSAILYYLILRLPSFKTRLPLRSLEEIYEHFKENEAAELFYASALKYVILNSASSSFRKRAGTKLLPLADKNRNSSDWAGIAAVSLAASLEGLSGNQAFEALQQLSQLREDHPDDEDVLTAFDMALPNFAVPLFLAPASGKSTEDSLLEQIFNSDLPMLRNLFDILCSEFVRSSSDRNQKILDSFASHASKCRNKNEADLFYGLLLYASNLSCSKKGALKFLKQAGQLYRSHQNSLFMALIYCGAILQNAKNQNSADLRNSLQKVRSLRTRFSEKDRFLFDPIEMALLQMMDSRSPNGLTWNQYKELEHLEDHLPSMVQYFSALYHDLPAGLKYLQKNCGKSQSEPDYIADLFYETRFLDDFCWTYNKN